MQTSENIGEIAAALVRFAEEAKNPPANKTATVQHKAGGQHSFGYPDFAVVVEQNRALLAKHGLTTVQTPAAPESGLTGISTMLVHSSGEWILLDPVMVPAGDTAQDFGGAISYARRYSYFAALGLVAHDDHGQAPSTQRQRAGSGAATKAQQNKISAEMKKAGVSDQQLVTVLQRDFGVETTGELTKAQASQVIERLIAEADRRAAAESAGADPVTGEVPPDEEPPGMDAGQYREIRGGAVEQPADDGRML